MKKSHNIHYMSNKFDMKQVLGTGKTKFDIIEGIGKNDKQYHAVRTYFDDKFCVYSFISEKQLNKILELIKKYQTKKTD